MKPVFFVFAGALSLAGGVVLWMRSISKETSAAMAATQTSRCADIAKIAPGTLVEVKGAIRCAEPVTSEFAQVPAAWFEAVVEEKVPYYERDSSGKQVRKTRTVVRERISRTAPFFVEDASGRVRVTTTNALKEGVKVYDEIEPPPFITGPMLGFDRSQAVFREYVLAPDQQAYVLGYVQNDRSIGSAPPTVKNPTFVISYKTEEQRARSAMWGQFWYLVGAGAFFAAAAVMVWLGFRM